LTLKGPQEHGCSVSRANAGCTTVGEGMMRFAMGLVLIAGMAGAALAQDTANAPDAAVKVRKLTLVATDLPNADWRTAAASLEGGTYGVEDLQERIQQKLRDEGYYFAHAENPQLTNVRQEGAGRSADAAVTIEAGDQYTMGEITFKRTTQFKNEQMRSQFPLVLGSVFNGSAVAVGLEKLKALYEAQGFADVGAVPSIAVNEARHVIDISVEVEEGLPYLFGQLTLDGAEPTPGESRALQAAWKELEGKRYNPDLLKKWLAANGPKSAKGAPALHPRAEGIADTAAHLMNVRLIFQ
jgi:outer membrane translocation and assembly module TamA